MVCALNSRTGTTLVPNTHISQGPEPVPEPKESPFTFPQCVLLSKFREMHRAVTVDGVVWAGARRDALAAVPLCGVGVDHRSLRRA